ncbi:MAG: WD40/YVTN/BNR-like repeat-containing protein [Bacillota bacterium]
MTRQMASRLLTAVLIAALLAGCSKPEEPPAPAEPPPAVEPPAPAAPTTLGTPDLARARGLVVERAPVPASAGPPLDLGEVAFVSAERGFGVGWNGAIYQTDDGGRVWRQLAQYEGVRFNRLLFTGGQVGWAFGYAGCGLEGEGCGAPQVARTTDGGQSWRLVEAEGLPAADSPSAWNMGLAILTGDLAYAVTPGTSLLRTTDGGRTWREVPLPEGVRAAGGLYFRSPERGYVSVSTPSAGGGKYGEQREYRVLVTEDGGRSWGAIYQGLVPITAIQFLDERRGFIGGGFGHYRVGPVSRIFLATEDGGATWEERNRETRFFQEAAPFTRFYFTSPTQGWAEQEHGPNVSTGDGGRTWITPVLDRFFLRPAVVGEHLWARWGEAGHAFLFHSSDGGVTWSSLYQRGALLPSRLQFLNPKAGWLSTPAGMLKTTDGGESWSHTGLLTPNFMPGIPTFLTEQTALRYVEDRSRLSGTLERSEDGGQTWRPVMANVANPWLSFVSPTIGYLVTRNQKHGPGSPYPDILMKSTDGGQTWQALRAEMPVGSMLSFSDEKHGAVAGGYADQRRLMLTADGGQSWLSLDLAGLWVRSVHYTRAGHLWLAVSEEAGERRGLLLHSLDRGASWEVFAVEGAGENLLQIHFTGPNEGWLIARLRGENDLNGELVLARTRDGGQTWQQVWP